MSIPQRTGFDRLPAMEGWAVVTAPPPKAKTGQRIIVTVASMRGTMRLSVSISGEIWAALGSPERVLVHENRIEKALMLVPCDPASDADAGFKVTAFGKNLKTAGGSSRHVVRLPAWASMTIETVGMPANGEVVDRKGAPVLVIRLPYGAFPSTKLGAR
jgi:hypothetical protein